MKILMINATPHKGNTWNAMCAVQEGILRVNSRVEFDVIHLSELNVPFCTGCSMCFRKGRPYCPHYKIMNEVFTKMEDSDGLILGATTFYMAPNAMAKNFLDHLCFLLHRPHFFKKKAIVVSSTGAVGANKAVNYMAGILQGIGYNRCYKLSIAAFSWNAYQPSKKGQKRITKASSLFYSDVASGKLHPPTMGVLIPYNLFRGMSLGYVKGTEYATEDGTYWTEPKRAKATYDSSIKIPLYKKFFGSVFYILGKTMGKYITVTYKK